MVTTENDSNNNSSSSNYNHHNHHTLPLIPSDQCRVESVGSCVDVLQHLDNVVQHVFNSITSRLQVTTTRLENLSRRAADAQAKVEKLTGINKATQIFSSAQYPGFGEYEPYSPIHKDENPVLFTPTPVKIKEEEINRNVNLKDKLQFYHVRERRGGGSGGLVGEEGGEREDGLGRLPPHLTSITSLLLFNTTHNPYKKYMVLDPLGVVSGTRGVPTTIPTTTTAGATLQDAPATLQDIDKEVLVCRDGYHYLPDLPDVPDLDLPNELPTLTGVANDLLYEGGADPTIAPSLLSFSSPLSPSSSSLPPSSSSHTSSSNPPQPNKPTPPPPQPTPTPPPPSQPTSTPSPVAPPPAPPPSSLPTPPPPPPPPPSSTTGPPLPPPPPPPPPSAPENVPAAVLSDARSDLMKAIQEAGGMGKAKLRKANKKKKEEDEEEEEEGKTRKKKGGGGDLMADLFQRLSQRRKGISGAPKPTQDGGGGGGGRKTTMDKISSLIPPPPLTEDGGGGGGGEEEDDDWD